MQPLPVYSFDVFDTCITRMHAYPRDLFFDLGVRLAPTTKDETERIRFAQRFQRARIRAEKLANWLARRTGHEHANIEDIYRQLRWFMRLDKTIAELVQAELALEEESLYPIDETVTKIRQLRASGCRILFISDMYIPADSLGPLLERLGVMVPSDGLYVSCDVGCSKHSGKLFAHVLKAEGITGAELVHTGDNAHADIRMAQLHGIQTVHFTPAHLTQREQIIAGKRIPRKTAASWQAAFSRRCRLAAKNDLINVIAPPLGNVIHTVIVPFLLAYVQWVLDDARQRGIQRLYFVARDGEVLFKIAHALQPEGLELRYLYGSRRAWLAPSISTSNVDWMRLLAVAGNVNAPRDIAARAGLSANEQSRIQSLLHLDEAAWCRQLSLQDADTFIKTLLENPAAKEVLFNTVAVKREAALAYLRQEGLMDGSNWALVDAGWSLNGQAALRRILKTVTSTNMPVQGYYIGLARDHLPADRAGKAYAFCNPAGNIFSRRRVVVEHCFLPASHASTRGYLLQEGVAEPDFSLEPRHSAELEYALHLHTAAVAAAKQLKQQPSMQDRIRTFRPQLTATAANFICNPGKQDASAYAFLAAVADMRQESEFAKSLCRPLSLADVWTTIGMALSKNMAFKAPAWMWLEGSVALSPTHVALPLKLMLQFDAVFNKIRTSRASKECAFEASGSKKNLEN